MKPNPDNRADNADRIQRNINMTIDNIHRANEMIARTPDQKMKQVLRDKNERRMEAINSMSHEFKDEVNAAKNRGIPYGDR